MVVYNFWYRLQKKDQGVGTAAAAGASVPLPAPGATTGGMKRGRYATAVDMTVHDVSKEHPMSR